MYMLPSAAVEVRHRGVEWSRGSARQSGSRRLGRLQLPKCTAASQPQGPSSRDPPPAALRTRGPVPTSGFRHLGIHSYVAPVLTARAAGLAALSQPAPPSPLARFLL